MIERKRWTDRMKETEVASLYREKRQRRREKEGRGRGKERDRER